MSEHKALSYIDAYRQMRAGKISWDVYLDHLLARLSGNGHDDDEILHLRHSELAAVDPFGYSIFCWSQDLDHLIKDVEPVKKVFQAGHSGSSQDTRDKLDSLRAAYTPSVMSALALLALQDRNADTLKLCLDQGGFPYQSCFVDEANRVDEVNDPEIFKVLEQSEFRRFYPKRPPRNDGDGEDGIGEDDSDDAFDPAVEFDEGGSHPVDW